MSTYTDLHNRVKENLTVDYNTRVTAQKISATNEENLFVGTFRGAFRCGSISQVSCIDCTMLSGFAKTQLMVEPLLSVGYNPQAQEPIISSLMDYIDVHGGSGSGYLTSADVIPEQLTGETVIVATIGGKPIYAPKSQQGVTDPLYVNDLSVGHSLSCGFDFVYDYSKPVDNASLQSQISAKASTTEVTSKIESEKKQFCQQVFDALSALPDESQVLDLTAVSRVLFDIRSLFTGLK